MATEKIREYSTPEQFSNELTISGTLLGHNKEMREWKDKTTGVAKQLEVDCIFLQSSIGVLVARCFNPKFNLSSLKVGDAVCFPVEEYKKENGLKAFAVRI